MNVLKNREITFLQIVISIYATSDKKWTNNVSAYSMQFIACLTNIFTVDLVTSVSVC